MIFRNDKFIIPPCFPPSLSEKIFFFKVVKKDLMYILFIFILPIFFIYFPFFNFINVALQSILSMIGWNMNKCI